ncbi:MAG: ParB/RepB/Spo0J family partition protein [Phycisphaerae bacterium]|jgi:ParB/RepB/Spo0J family partition protein
MLTVENKLQIKYVSVDSVKLNPKNPRDNDGAVDAVAGSMKRFDWTNPILVRKANNVIIAGHTRWKAAKKLGIKSVPVIFCDMTEAQADAYMLADNKLSELASWDDAALTKIIAELQEQGVDLLSLGFDQKEIDKLFATQKELGSGEIPDIPEYLTFIVTPEQRAEIELKLDAEDGQNRTEQLLCLIRRE